MKNKFFALLVTGLITLTGFAQDFDKTKLDGYFDALETNNKFMGSVAVSKNGEIVYLKSIGYADFENKVKGDENSKYRIGSISKTFTAVLILKAVEQNKIELGQTIDKYFPTIKNANKITISHLLTHRSGIHSFTSDKDYVVWNTQTKTENEMMKIIEAGGSDFAPDSKAQYSNSNYLLLTYILERSFGEPYGVLVKKYIANPLGLKNTFLGGKIDVSNNECKSYQFVTTWKLQSETDTSIPMGAGGIVSTPSDLLKFSNALFKGELIKEESVEQMKTLKDNFGMGLFKIPFNDKVGYGHTGGIDGFSSVFSYFSDGDISYALTSNGSNFNNNNISIAVLSAFYGQPYAIPEFTTYEIAPEDLDQYVGVYFSVQIPLKITIAKDKGALVAQATGQSAFSLESTDKDKFKFDRAGVVMEFNTTDKTMVLKQRGAEFLYTKE